MPVRESIQFSFYPNHRETMEALARARFTNQEYRVVIALLNETDGRVRDERELTSSSWQALTLLSRQHVHETLGRLIPLNVIACDGQRYRVNHPNDWDPKLFQPQRLARRAVVSLRSFLHAEKEKHNFRWLSTIVRSVPNHGRPPRPEGVRQQGRKRPQPRTVSSPTTDALGGTTGGDEKRRDITTPKGVARRKGRAPPDPRVKETLTAMRTEFGFPEKTDIDPIPNYGAEGRHIKRMLTRGFTPETILSVWRGKISKRRGEFVSMHWVNEDIGKEVRRGEPGEHPAADSGMDFDFGELRDTGIEPE